MPSEVGSRRGNQNEKTLAGIWTWQALFKISIYRIPSRTEWAENQGSDDPLDVMRWSDTSDEGDQKMDS